MKEVFIYCLSSILGVSVVIILLLSIEQAIRWFITLAERSAFAAGKERPKFKHHQLTEDIMMSSALIIFLTTLTYFVRNVFLVGLK